MNTSKNAIAKNQKNVSATKKETQTKKAETKITNLNLSQFAEKLNSIEVKEKKQKETLYRYPENFSQSDINSEKGKTFRNSLRNKRKRFVNNVLFAAKQMNVKKDADAEKALKDHVNAFNDFYKENYLCNDFSLKSVSASSKDEMNAEIELCLQICKSVL